MATLPIHLEVEDVAVGPVLITLKKMPGIIKMNLILDNGTAAPIAPRLASGQTFEQTVMALLMKSAEPLHIKHIAAQLGGPRSRTSGALHGLRKKGVIKGLGKGMWTLTDKARRGTQKLLPSPTKMNGHHVPEKMQPSVRADGRASKGAATAIMLKALTEKPLKPIDIAPYLDAGGASAKGLSGVMLRGRRDGLIKKNTSGEYELTAKGQREAATGA